jgi:hypothetical protein
MLRLGAFLLLLSGCGYHLRGTDRLLFDQNQIRRLHVAPVRNDSYKAGVDILIYNAVRKRLASGGYVTLTEKAEDADAVLNTTVLGASYSPLSLTTSDQLAPLRTGPSFVQVATSYLVTLNCKFSLQKGDKILWQNSVLRSKSFVAQTYLGILGTTSALINESEFERTLTTLADSVSVDADEMMNAVF